jgi:hypothetical protein
MVESIVASVGALMPLLAWHAVAGPKCDAIDRRCAPSRRDGAVRRDD